MCDRYISLEAEVEDLEKHADDLKKEIEFLQAGLARALNTDLAGMGHFLLRSAR